MRDLISILLVIAMVLNISCSNSDKLPAYKNSDLDTDVRVADLLSKLTLEEKISLLAGESAANLPAIERLGIPELRMKDGPHGVTTTEATCFPTGVNMGASWDPDLVEKVGAALGRETRANNYQIILGPCINIHRQPLGGRNFESFSEDPFLSAEITKGYVNGVQSEKIAVCVKHFAANNQEKERHYVSSEVDERSLREIYFPAFKAAAEADAWSFMAAYNKLNGIFCTESSWLLRDVLKGEWQYPGCVISDWGAVHDIIKTNIAGNDLNMPECSTKELLLAAQKGEISQELIDDNLGRIIRLMIKTGLLDDEKIEGEANTKEHQQLAYQLAAESMVLLKNKSQLLPLNKKEIKKIALIGPNVKEARLGGLGSSKVDAPYAVTVYDAMIEKYADDFEILYDKGCDFNEMPAVQSKYLKTPSGEQGLKGLYYNGRELKGEPILERIDSNIDFNWPLGTPGDNVPSAGYSITWTGKLTAPKTGTYVFGLTNNDNARLFINGKLIIDNWTDLRLVDPKTAKIDLVAGKEYDIQVDFNQWGATAGVRLSWIVPEMDLIQDSFDRSLELAKQADKVLYIGGFSDFSEGEGADRKTMKLPGMQDKLIKELSKVNPNLVVVLINGSNVAMPWIDNVPSVVEAYYPNQEGGNAIVDLLFGEVNPSGKLPESFPIALKDNPAYKYYPGTKDEVHYKEGIFVGYRHYDTRNIDVLFPFGHGLSYTTFEYKNLKVEHLEGSQVVVEFDISNTGSYSGKEIAQIYVSDLKASAPRPTQELKGFEKVSLEAGERKTVRLELTKSAFSFWNDQTKEWILEPGEFQLSIGASSRDIRLSSKINLD